MKTISFDFDDSICMEDGSPNFPMLAIIKKHHKLGNNCVIVTARNKENEENPKDEKRIIIKEFLKKFNLPIKNCYFTNHELKGPILKKINADTHYDDDETQLKSAKENGIKAIKSPSPFDIEIPHGKSKNNTRK